MEQVALAVVLAAMLSASAAHAGRHDAPRAAAGRGTPAIHTAVHAGALHHRRHRGARGLHGARRHHATVELRSARAAAGPVGPPRLPHPDRSREPHPRATLPVLVRPGHHPSWGGGSRTACIPAVERWTLSLNGTRIALDHDSGIREAEHQANAARGPPRPRPIAQNPPACFARSRPILSPARLDPPTSHSTLPARGWRTPAPGTRRSPRTLAGVPRRSPRTLAAVPRRSPRTLAGVPRRESAFTFVVVPASPHGRANVRRRESAAAFPPWLSTGGVS
jgi:hypothetical protein